MKKLQQRLIELTLKDEPESVKKMTLSQFQRMNFESEDSFLDYLDEFETEAGEKESKSKKDFKSLKIQPKKDEVLVESILNNIMR
jgi:hypothetical protein